MLKKTLLIAALTFLALPASAQLVGGQTSSTPQLSSSDEEFFSEMPDTDFPGAVDTDGDGIADGNVTDMLPGTTPDGGMTAEPQKTVKYVYKPGSDTNLRRLIQDPRIEDGYVQGLMQQRSPVGE